MDTERPRFRNDLVAQPIEEEGIRYVDVTDPDSGSTFRFYDVEYSIACAMDGHKDLAGLVEWTRGELGIDTSVDELEGVVSTLAELGYLEAAAQAAEDDDGSEEFAHSEPTRNVANEVMEKQARDLEARHRDGRDGAAGKNVPISSDPRAKVPTRRLTPEPIPTVNEDSKDVDLDMDLSAHAKLTKEDVKEAVRASRVVTVPNVSKDLLESIESEAKGTSKPGSGAQPLPSEAPRVARPVDAPRIAERSAVAKQSSVGPVIVILLLVVVAAGAAYYFMVYKPEHEQSAPGSTSEAAEPAGAPSARGSAASGAGFRPEAALAEMQGGAPVEAKAAGAGVVEWTADAAAAVEKDAPVVKLMGARRFEQAAELSRERLTFYKDQLAKAQAEKNAAMVAANQKKVEEKQALVDDAESKLAPLVVKAPASGKVEILVEKGAKVNAGDPVARVAGGPALGAAFQVAGPVAGAYKAGDPCAVAVKGQPDKQISCVVDAVEGTTLKVKLVGDVPAKAGETVVLVR